MQKAVEIGNLALREKVEFEAGATNKDILSDPERKFTRIILSDKEARLVSLDQEIARLAALHAELHSQREELEKGIARCHVALAPHKRLPAEILAEIFVCAMGEQQLEFHPKQNQREFPWVIRKVCSKWREVAVNEPRLWRQLCFNSADIEGQQVPKLASALRSVLLSADSLTIELVQHVPADFPATIAVIDMIILPNLPHTKALSLTTSLPSFIGLVDMAYDAFTSLETLCLNLWSGSEAECASLTQCFSDAIALQNAPKLRKLELRAQTGRSWITMALMTTLPIPWRQLTSLVISDHPIRHRDLRRILSACHSLHSLQANIRCYPDDSIIADDNPARNLPYLCHVTLSAQVKNPAALTRLQLPWHQLITLKLERLTILEVPPYRLVDWAPSIHHILRQCVQIERLSVHIPYEQHERLPDALVGTIDFPRLQGLKLDVLEPHILDYLVVPALTSLELRNKRSFPAKELLGMIRRSGCSLSTFTNEGTEIHPDDLRDFHSCLSLSPSLRELRMKHLSLQFPSIEIILGALLPQLEILECGLHPLAISQFVDRLVERAKAGRGKNTMNAMLRRAHGYTGVTNVNSGLLAEFDGRLERMNVEYGTDFGVHLD